MTSLLSRVIVGVKNMLTKRGETEFTDLETKIGTSFQTSNVLVFIPEILNETVTKIKNDTVNYIFFLAESHQLKHILVVYSQITPRALDILTGYQVYEIELFREKMMLFDPTVHKKTPPHLKMTPEEVEAELPGIHLEHLPSIKETDVIMRFYNWKAGSVIKVIRPDGPSYRLIIAN